MDTNAGKVSTFLTLSARCTHSPNFFILSYVFLRINVLVNAGSVEFGILGRFLHGTWGVAKESTTGNPEDSPLGGLVASRY